MSKHDHPILRHPIAIVAWTSFFVFLGTGCVERRMTIRTDPPDALVVLDGQMLENSPCSTSFHYYGERQIKLIKPGYETKTINQTISTPWYQIPPIDFISEALIPWRIRDERTYTYTLEPVQAVPNTDLLQRATTIREQGQNPPGDVLRRAGVSTPTPAE